MIAQPSRTYAVGAVLAEGTARAIRTSAARAAVLAEALVSAGVPRERLAAVCYGDRVDEEDYDGPSTLAPGNAMDRGVRISADRVEPSFLPSGFHPTMVEMTR